MQDHTLTAENDDFSVHSFYSVLLYIPFARREVLERIESIILGIVTSLSKDEAPVLVLPNRSSWANVRWLGLNTLFGEKSLQKDWDLREPFAF